MAIRAPVCRASSNTRFLLHSSVHSAAPAPVQPLQRSQLPSPIAPACSMTPCHSLPVAMQQPTPMLFTSASSTRSKIMRQKRRVACASSLTSSAGAYACRAADVVVIGNSCTAAATALAMAKAGMRVVYLPNMGLESRAASSAGDVNASSMRGGLYRVRAGEGEGTARPLHLPHVSPHMVAMAGEAAAYWRGLSAQALAAGAALPLRACRSVDLAGWGGSTHSGEALLSALQAGCAGAGGVRAGVLRAAELSLLLPRGLVLPPHFRGLAQTEGGVLLPPAAWRMLTALARKAGADVRDDLQLIGWRDQGGSQWQISAGPLASPASIASGGGASCVWEAEQMVLAPGDVEAPHALALFGLRTHVQALSACRVSAAAPSTTDCAGLPLWRYLAGLQGRDEEDAHKGATPEQAAAAVAAASAGHATAGSSGSGLALPWSRATLSPRAVWGYPPASTDSGCMQLVQASASPHCLHNTTSLLVSNTMETTTTSGSGGDLMISYSIQLGLSQAGYQPLVDLHGGGTASVDRDHTRALYSAARRLMPGMGSVLQAQQGATPSVDGADKDPSISSSSVCSWLGASPDGFPLLGSHPGYEEGRLMLVLAGGTRTATHASLAAAAVAARSASAESTAMQQARGLHALGTSNNLHASPTSPARPDALAAAPSPSAGAEGIDVECDAGLLHDSFQLSLLLGKAVAASLGAGGAMRAAGEVLPVDIGLLALWRVAAGAVDMRLPQQMDTWEQLAKLQQGGMWLSLLQQQGHHGLNRSTSDQEGTGAWEAMRNTSEDVRIAAEEAAYATAAHAREVAKEGPQGRMYVGL